MGNTKDRPRAAISGDALDGIEEVHVQMNVCWRAVNDKARPALEKSIGLMEQGDGLLILPQTWGLYADLKQALSWIDQARGMAHVILTQVKAHMEVIEDGAKGGEPDAEAHDEAAPGHDHRNPGG